MDGETKRAGEKGLKIKSVSLHKWVTVILIQICIPKFRENLKVLQIDVGTFTDYNSGERRVCN